MPELASDLPGLALHSGGKVREMYDLGDRLLMVASDRISAYDVVLQQNEDGRVRALYKRVYVGFDDQGHPYTTSEWIYGPDDKDRVPINYAN